MFFNTTWGQSGLDSGEKRGVIPQLRGKGNQRATAGEVRWERREAIWQAAAGQRSGNTLACVKGRQRGRALWRQQAAEPTARQGQLREQGSVVLGCRQRREVLAGLQEGVPLGS